MDWNASRRSLFQTLWLAAILAVAACGSQVAPPPSADRAQPGAERPPLAPTIVPRVALSSTTATAEPAADDLSEPKRTAAPLSPTATAEPSADQAPTSTAEVSVAQRCPIVAAEPAAATSVQQPPVTTSFQLGWATLPNFPPGELVRGSMGLSLSLNDIVMVDENVGWVVGSNGVIGRTTDGGDNIVLQRSGTATGLTAVSFVNDQVGWAVGNFGIVLCTSDGGDNWELLQNAPASLESVVFVDSDSGWAAGASGAVLHTGDGGATWTSQPTGVTDDLQDVAFIDHQTGWAVGWGGTILHTDDGGNSWTEQDSGTDGILWSATFPDKDHGTVVGERGLVLHTSDGGINWIRQGNGVTEDLYDVFFLDAQTGWAVGSKSTILETRDGGVIWTSPKEVTASGGSFKAVWFTGAESGIAVGTSNLGLRFGPVATE